MVPHGEGVLGGGGRTHGAGAGAIIACGKEHEETLLIGVRAVVGRSAVVDVLGG